MAFGVEVPLMIFREGSGVAALACCRAAPDSLLLIHFLRYNIEEAANVVKKWGANNHKRGGSSIS